MHVCDMKVETNQYGERRELMEWAQWRDTGETQSRHEYATASLWNILTVTVNLHQLKIKVVISFHHLGFHILTPSLPHYSQQLLGPVCA